MAEQKRIQVYDAGLLPGLKEVNYEGVKSDNPLALKWFNPNREINNTTMGELLDFGVAYWHTLRGMGQDMFGGDTFQRLYNEAKDDPVEQGKVIVNAAFEVFTKLGITNYCFHDRDIVDPADTLSETYDRIDAVVDELAKLQEKTGVKLLWNTSNKFTDRQFMHACSEWTYDGCLLCYKRS
jgi:xylose isomerase